MKDITMHTNVSFNFIRSLMFSVTFLIMAPIVGYVLGIARGINGDNIYNPSICNLLVAGTLFYHAYRLSIILVCEQTLKLSIVSGFVSGVILTLASRVGMVIAYLLLVPDKKLEKLGHIFIDYWSFYLYMALLGMICMSIKPLFKIVRYKDSLEPNKIASDKSQQ